jgi:hypothetical protein
MRLNLILTAVLGLMLARCARETIIELPEEPPRLVAICHFTEGQHFRVKVSLSKSVNDGSKPFFPDDVDATLSINGNFWDRLHPDTTDKENITYWESNQVKIARPEIDYAFSVRVPGYPTITSRSKIPAHVPLEPLLLTAGDITVTPLNETLHELRVPLALQLTHLPADNHYFAFNLTHETNVYDPAVPSTVDFTEAGGTNFLADGRTFSLLHDIPEPVVLVNENFWADGRKTLFLTARIPFIPGTERPHLIFVEWRTLSPEFYRYHLSLSRQGGNLPLSDPDAVFNNIENGYGNFSGYAVSVDTVIIPNF